MGKKNRGGKKKQQKKKQGEPARPADEAHKECCSEDVQTSTNASEQTVAEEPQVENAFEQRAIEQQRERTSYLKDEPISQVNTDEDVIKLEQEQISQEKQETKKLTK